VSTSSSDEPGPVYRSKLSQSAPESLGRQYPESSEESPTTSDSISSIESPEHSTSQLPTSSFCRAATAWMTRSSLAVPPLPTSSSMQATFSRQSTKPRGGQPPPPQGTAGPDDRRYAVRFGREPAKIVAQYGHDNEIFRPTLAQLTDELRLNPKQYPKKRGKLKNTRGADLRFGDGVPWRAVFTIDEAARIVRVISLESHDQAYRSAKRR
jgi:mRNA-degrading endonuclease RelE of RelBE toxin-antitoxin system